MSKLASSLVSACTSRSDVRAIAAVITFTMSSLVIAADYQAPRGPGGQHPDLNGIWQAMNEANYNIERHMARASVQVVTGPMGPIPAKPVLAMGAAGAVPPGLGVIEGGGPLPYTEAGRAKQIENQANWSKRDPEVKCYLPGIPRATYIPQPFQILQGEDSIFFTYQYAGAVRDIHLTDPGEAPVDSWMGQSFGWWEGDTLVIEVTGQLADTWFDRAGNHHSDKLKVTERYTRVSDHHLLYEATIEDVETYTKPFTISMPLYRRMEPDMQLMDFKCVEFVEELIYGDYRRPDAPTRDGNQ
ncbi:MAG: hypothetical protein AAF525_06060 [Pseudomonadota bacterium]